MALTNAGRDLITAMLFGTTETPFNAANAYIGVGDSTTAFATTQTDLQATTNFLRKGMDSGFPTIAGNILTFESTFASAEANFAWNEWAIHNAASAGTMLDRVVEYNGTKLSGQTWVLKLTTTVAIGS
jgi:hypothetical protein